MKKNGFVFVESVVVLVVVALSLATLISSYSLIKRKTQEKEYYDKASDKYLLYSISNIGTDDNCNYGIDCLAKLPNVSTDTYRNSSNHISFRADKNDDDHFDCSKSKLGQILHDCNKVFEEFNIEHIYVVDNVVNELNKKNDSGRDTTEFFDNGTIEYLKSLKKCNDLNFTINNTTCNYPIVYMIGVFKRSRTDYYYASIELASFEPNDTEPITYVNGWYWANRNQSASLEIDQQIWYYYEDNVPLKGLNKIATSNDGGSTYYYYFDNTGVMQVGWVYYDGVYHLYSPIDYDGGGDLDGRRIQSCTNSRLLVPVNGTNYYFDRQGVCYTCSSGNCLCNENDTLSRVNSISISEANYRCNGD